MSFTDAQVGIERGATQLLFEREPVVLKDKPDLPPRAMAISLSGTPISVEFITAQDERNLYIVVEFLSKADTSTLFSILRGTGPVTVKIEAGVSTTLTCTFAPDQGVEPVNARGYPESTATEMIGYRATLHLLIQT